MDVSVRWVSIGSGNGLSPAQHKAITWSIHEKAFETVVCELAAILSTRWWVLISDEKALQQHMASVSQNEPI